MKLIIGNKNYSSWSLRGWLACKQAGLSFEELLVPLFGEDWDALKQKEGDLTPSSGKVPVLWDGDDEAGAVVGAGSVIGKDVAPDSLALTRAKQTAVDGWAKRKRAQQETD